jgi:DNA-binding NarL/FixJ family response regulator
VQAQARLHPLGWRSPGTDWQALQAVRRPQRRHCPRTDWLWELVHSQLKNVETRQEQNETAQLQERYAKLTVREREVMRLMIFGMISKQIASTLGTSEITVTVHRGQVMRKMQANSPAELGRIAEKLKLPTMTSTDR